jgi:NitT/TauT family transport system ATP-binding protein
VAFQTSAVGERSDTLPRRTLTTPEEKTMKLSVQNLSVVFEAPDGGSLPALGPISFDIGEQQFVVLVGPSGCGKSTLVRVLAGLQKTTQGRASYDGEPLTSPSPRVGLMFQEANLMPWRTVIDNVVLPLELASIDKPSRYAAARELLSLLNLEEFASAYPGELSGGMAQRVALGRVLSQDPDVLLLDEPFGALDAMTREQVSFDLLKAWARKRQTVFMVTHDIQEAVLLADRVMVMSRRPGQLIADVTVPMDRPRRLDMIYTPEFIATARAVREALARA